jgi:peptidoglycan hydrolase-like protein with peptidoglycan-binding domain
MPLLSFGKRGAPVSQLQTSLNSLPTRLPRLHVDAVFGQLTLARVKEFQRDNGLKPDGIVGDLTSGKIASLLRNPAQVVNFAQIANELATSLRPQERSSFMSMAGPMVIANPAVIPAVVIEAMMLLLILMLFAAILQNSQSKASKQAGRDLQREIERLTQKLKSNPEASESVAQEALDKAKKEGRALEQRTREERKKCFDKFTPDQLAKKLQDCAKFLKDVEILLQSLVTIIGRPVGGGGTGFHPQDIIRGISRVSGELIAALRSLGTCMGCDNLFF